MKRKCCGCWQRKEVYCDVGPRAYYCIDCARSGGITGGKPTNVAEKNSREWKKQPCKHPSQQNRFIKVHNTTFMVGECRRCHTEVFRVKHATHDGRRWG